MADNALIPVVIHITPQYYEDKGHFWERLETVKRLYADHMEKVLLIVSYRFCKPYVTRKQTEHFAEVKRHFPNIVIVHAAGVEWNGHDAEIRGMGIPIFEEGYNAGL